MDGCNFDHSVRDAVRQSFGQHGKEIEAKVVTALLRTHEGAVKKATEAEGPQVSEATSRGLRWTLALATSFGSQTTAERSQVSSTAMLGAFSKTLKCRKRDFDQPRTEVPAIGYFIVLRLLSSKLQRVPLDPQAHAVALSALGSAWRRVLGLLPKSGGVSAQEVAIQACSMAMQQQKASWEEALQLLSKSEEMSILPSCVSFLAVAEGLFARPVLSHLQGYLHAPSSQERCECVDFGHESFGGAWQRRFGRAQVAELVRLSGTASSDRKGRLEGSLNLVATT
eukprot:s534_g3.t1